MPFLYNIAIILYSLLIRLASPFNAKAAEWIKGRKTWKEGLKGLSLAEGKKLAWFHAASLGEFEQGRPVIEAFRKQHPDYYILLTFYSPSGYLQKKNYEGADKVIYLPADIRSNAQYFVSNLKPDIAVFIKYEFWFNYLSALKSMQVPTVFISALFRKNQLFFKWYGSWFRKILRNVDHYFVQDEASLKLIQSIGITHSTISGDTRFDRVADILESKHENKEVEAFCANHKVVLAGSTWAPDEKILTHAIKSLPEVKFIIAPHEVKAERIKEISTLMGEKVARYTLDDPSSWMDKQVLIIDTIGVLSSIYRYADIAYIGGGFETGLHNIQEPAVNGMPVLFGPKYHKFREAVDLVHQEGAFTVSSEDQLLNTLNTLLTDKAKYQKSCELSKKYMLDNTGATQIILKGLSKFL